MGQNLSFPGTWISLPILESVRKNKQNIIVVDCCEHIISALERLQYNIITLHPGAKDKEMETVDLIVTGVSQFPIRRSLISELRRFYPAVPTLILRRESPATSIERGLIRGEFILSDQVNSTDLDMVRRMRSILPLPGCEHTRLSDNYGLAQNALRVIRARYSDTALDLPLVARELAVSPKRLSRVLNQEAGMSFRQLLRNIRVEEAKRMLSSGEYSIKQIAAHVGFSDGHYFSRSFKEVSGQSATEFRALRSVPR
jgi:AraC-like DNA-binding protein